MLLCGSARCSDGDALITHGVLPVTTLALSSEMARSVGRGARSFQKWCRKKD